MDLILKYFPDLTPEQQKQFRLLQPVYTDWNAKINVISRKDINSFYEHHVLHSLAIAKIIQFKDKTRIVDIGTGGGFPGIPLAILFPKCSFTLVDSIGKKIHLVNEVIKEIGLSNVTTLNHRAENLTLTCDFIVSRAVTQMPVFVGWIQKLIQPGGANALKNGILYLKGGDLTEELAGINYLVKEFPISGFYTEPFFETKKVVYVQF
ncbi:MAG: 16S rRNA (guanine(527)-N(7))-methyltransferase RsmG [Flavobacteriales bacterium]